MSLLFLETVFEFGCQKINFCHGKNIHFDFMKSIFHRQNFTIHELFLFRRLVEQIAWAYVCMTYVSTVEKLRVCDMIFFCYIEYCVKWGLTRGRSTIAFQTCSSIKTKRLQPMTTALNGWSKQDWKMIQCPSTKLSIEEHEERTSKKIEQMIRKEWWQNERFLIKTYSRMLNSLIDCLGRLQLLKFLCIFLFF